MSDLPELSKAFQTPENTAKRAGYSWPIIWGNDGGFNKTIHTSFDPEHKFGTSIFLRALPHRSKYEIIIRNYLGGNHWGDREDYNIGADQELKLETYGGFPGAPSSRPYQIRMYNDLLRRSRQTISSASVTWDGDSSHTEHESWRVDFERYQPFLRSASVEDVYHLLHRFTSEALEITIKGQMPDFSRLNEITGATSYSPPPSSLNFTLPEPFVK